MKDIDANKVLEWDALWREGILNGKTASRILELQKVYERYPRVWTWVDTTVANVPEIPDLILSFVYFKLLKLLSEANESEHKLKDIKSRHVPLFSSPIPKTVRLDTVSLYEWAKKSYPNCVMWYGLSIARDIQEGRTFGGFQSATLIAILVEMLEQANAD